MGVRRIKSPGTQHDPGTPDCEVVHMRQVGRASARLNDKDSLPGKGQPGRTDWWLGWYDERLRHIFGRE